MRARPLTPTESLERQRYWLRWICYRPRADVLKMIQPIRVACDLRLSPSLITHAAEAGGANNVRLVIELVNALQALEQCLQHLLHVERR